MPKGPTRGDPRFCQITTLTIRHRFHPDLFPRVSFVWCHECMMFWLLVKTLSHTVLWACYPEVWVQQLLTFQWMPQVRVLINTPMLTHPSDRVTWAFAQRNADWAASLADDAFGAGEKATKKKNEASHFLLWDFGKNENIAYLVMLWLEEESTKTKWNTIKGIGYK